MNKIRCFLAVIALVATLSGLSLQGMASLAHAASSQHTSAPTMAGHVMRPNSWPCAGGGGNDC